MNITRDVVTDLLPLYFSGEASEDTRRFVEEFFRENPDFERVARAAAKPLESLQSTAPVAPDAEKEKCEIRRVGWELRSRRTWLVLAAFYTLWPLVPLVSSPLAAWLGAPHTWGGRISVWCVAGLFWVLYITRPSWRNLPLIGAILATPIAAALLLNRLDIIPDRAAHASTFEIICVGIAAAFCWFLHFRARASARY